MQTDVCLLLPQSTIPAPFSVLFSGVCFCVSPSYVSPNMPVFHMFRRVAPPLALAPSPPLTSSGLHDAHRHNSLTTMVAPAADDPHPPPKKKAQTNGSRVLVPASSPISAFFLAACRRGRSSWTTSESRTSSPRPTAGAGGGGRALFLPLPLPSVPDTVILRRGKVLRIRIAKQQHQQQQLHHWKNTKKMLSLWVFCIAIFFCETLQSSCLGGIFWI